MFASLRQCRMDSYYALSWEAQFCTQAYFFSMNICMNVFIHSSVSKHLFLSSSSHIVNNDAMNMGVQVYTGVIAFDSLVSRLRKEIST